METHILYIHISTTKTVVPDDERAQWFAQRITGRLIQVHTGKSSMPSASRLSSETRASSSFSWASSMSLNHTTMQVCSPGSSSQSSSASSSRQTLQLPWPTSTLRSFTRSSGYSWARSSRQKSQTLILRNILSHCSEEDAKKWWLDPCGKAHLFGGLSFNPN